MDPVLLQTVFWGSAGVVVYTFAGYPVLVWILSWILARPTLKRFPVTFPRVSVVLAAGDERERIAARLDNLLASDYPSERMEIVVVSDGSTDGTAEVVAGYADRGVRLVRQERRSGKAACLNAGVPRASGEIIVLCDARQRFSAGTISELAANFADAQVGAVSGELFIESAESGVGGGVDLYWKLEKFIRESEARFSSVIGATGAVYAIRKELFEPLPVDTLLDDVVIPMRIALRGYRVGFDPGAPAFDPQTTDPAREKRRKLRTLAGNFQLLFRYPAWLSPRRTGLWWQLLSHKYARVFAPFFMASMWVTNALLSPIDLYRWLFQAHCGFYLLALLGGLLPGAKSRLLSIPSGFVFLNLMAVGGLWNYLRGAYREGRW